MFSKIFALGALVATVTAGLYQGLGHGPAVSSQSIVRHVGYAPLGHFAAPAHYAAPLAHASPLAYYAAPAPYAANYDSHVASTKYDSKDTVSSKGARVYNAVVHNFHPVHHHY